MISYKKKIFKIPFPFTDLSAKKVRPALALTEPDATGDIEFVFITSKSVNKSNVQYALGTSDYKAETLPIDSFIRIDKIFLLSKDIIIKELSEIKDEAFEEILKRRILLLTSGFIGSLFKST